jgi:hypothetical protein
MGRKRNDLETISEEMVIHESNEEVPMKKAEKVKEIVYNRTAIGAFKDPKTGWMHHFNIILNDEMVASGDLTHAKVEIKGNGDNAGVIKERILIEVSKRNGYITNEGDFFNEDQ